jgi:hypothetical protein
VFFRIGLCCLYALAVAACSTARSELPSPTVSPAPVPLPTLFPTPTGLPAPAPASVPSPQPTPPPDTGWLHARPGLTLRRLRPPAAPAPVSIVRLDPARVRFRVGYDPVAPQSIEAWANRTGAVAVINAGFFDIGNTTTALLVQDGVAIGESYVGRGGMFTVGPDEQVALRSLADAPYNPDEPLAQALQGWPLLVRPGGEAAYTYEDGERARRSALAIDASGNILLIVSAVPAFTLAELSAWLADADLDITTAVNLDGGASTGLLLASDTAGERISSFVALPIVLLVLPME